MLSKNILSMMTVLALWGVLFGPVFTSPGGAMEIETRQNKRKRVSSDLDYGGFGVNHQEVPTSLSVQEEYPYYWEAPIREYIEKNIDPSQAWYFDNSYQEQNNQQADSVLVPLCVNDLLKHLAPGTLSNEEEGASDENQASATNPRKKRKTLKEADRQKIKDLKIDGLNASNIAEEIDCHESTVRRNLKKAAPSLIETQKKHKTTEPDRQKMKDLKKKGFTYPEIAEKIGCHESTVIRNLKKYDPSLIKRTRSQKEHKTTESDRQKMIDLKQGGLSISNIAKEIDCHESTVRRYLKKMDPSLIKTITIKKSDRQKMIDLKMEGFTYLEIAKELGCSRNTVINYLKE